MRNRRLVVAVACATLSVAATARAQSDSARTGAPAAVEVTPYAFLGSDASSGIGAAVRWPLPGRFSLEVETAYRRTEVAPMSSYVSLLYDLPTIGRVTPYVAGGIGVDQYAFADTSPGGTFVPHVSTALAVTAGAGVRVRVDETWGMQTDARWSNGLGSRAPERLRLYNGVTFSPGGR